MAAGKLLKNLREEKGIDLEQIHKKTKLHYNIINALEEDRLHNINSTYVKGFIKIYCRALEVDDKEYIKAYQQSLSRASQREKDKEKVVLDQKPVDKVRFCFKKPFRLKRFITKLSIIVGLFLSLWMVFSFISFLGRKIFSRVKNKPTAEIAVSKKSVSLLVKKTKSNNLSKSVYSKYPVNITLDAKGKIWVSVKVDGKTVKHGALTKGASETWRAKKEILLTVNNAGYVDLEFNGQRFSPLGKKGQAYKNVKITTSGISIPNK